MMMRCEDTRGVIVTATEQKLEGRFRAAHSELITNCEQIAFIGGEAPEQRVLDEKFRSIIKHTTMAMNLSFNSEVLRQYLNKYFVTVIGLFLVSRPVRLGLYDFDTATGDMISQYFVSTWRNMEAMSSSIQDLFELTNRVGRLSGLATRVKQLMHGLEHRDPVLQEQIAQARAGPYPPTFQRGMSLIFEHVSIYKPDGTLLVKDLNFCVKPGDRVLITGANGCGKSSLFRVIRKLWPLAEGTITMPANDEMYFLSQVNFVPLGTLRDLITYPHTHEEMRAAGRTDEEVAEVLDWAQVSPFVVVDGRAGLQFTVEGKVVRPKLDDVRDWQKDLSPGQKQKIAFARLFFHRPKLVILDDCTNGVSPDVEQDLYGHCERLGLAVVSISHKIELKTRHDRELHFLGDADGSWMMMRCEDTRGVIVTANSFREPAGDDLGEEEGGLEDEK
eukprot:NODE_8350_length_1502_cov_7.282182.p1 GENE.NODE_8350_length_1502_cov_7.282182~~NODE_8350_length_1502_cov_7.282182.p1  ORF type:complete len:472 (+),score=154.60 NODE_8350_length_1502_cov_7.282182:84-1418(+)